MNSIKKILIANRGEIALRIMHTANSMGIEVVCLYTKGEEQLPHVVMARNKICIGEEGNLQNTYLNIEKILEVAKDQGCDAIHPGYGLLSENANFAKRCEESGFIFIGPRVKNISLMGDKINSKKTMEVINIPLIPGFHSSLEEMQQIQDSFLLEKAKEIKWPVLIKASAGGGGKGMRIVYKEENFFEELSMARSEAKKAFNNDLVFLEKWLDHPRHIEAQILCDSFGNCFFLGERECSIQRRYQKIIEESPCIFLTKKNRDDLKSMALKIAQHINYLGVGTLEFLFQDGAFYFLEMNTRIQVEHPVTEMVHGLDLVELQIKVAQGEELKPTLLEEHLNGFGHAIEVRICAEVPEQNYMPASGEFLHINVPQLPFNRFDFGYTSKNFLSVYFDPMLAKIICFGMDRNSAIEKMIYTLKNSSFLGTNTNKNFLLAILGHEEFKKGNTFTHFLKNNHQDLMNFIQDEKITIEEMGYFLASIINENQNQHHMSEKSFEQSRKVDYWENIPTYKGMSCN